MITSRRLRLPTDVELEVLEAGAPGAAPLLLVHGFTGAKEDFADHLDALAGTGHHVVAPDLRGHGSSDHPAGQESYRLDAFAHDVLALAGELGWDRFSLLGHSMGGMVVQRVAITTPDRLSALILMDTGHGPVGGVDPELVSLGRAVVAEGGMPLLIEASREQPGALDTPAHQQLLATRPGYREFCDAKVLACSPEMWLGMVDELLVSQADRLEALAAAVRAPTLVIVGEQDEAFVAPSHRIAHAVPGARIVVIPDAGHSPQFENPGAWLAAVTPFLAEVRTGAPA